MSFKEIVIEIGSKNADKLSDVFFELGALSVTVNDQYEGTELEQPIFNEPGMIINQLWEHSRVIVLFNANDNIEQIIATAKILFGGDFSYKINDVDDQDWVKLTQSQFNPIKITDSLYIVPSWCEPPHWDAVTITLDPGLAFGTGSHPTTFMCLKWIANNVNSTLSVLDYGCGSGILAICAAKMGTDNVFGVDIDDQAIQASIFNSVNNRVNISFLTPDNISNDKKFDVVVANILSNPLRVLAPMLADRVVTGGQIVLSGILEDQAIELSEIYSRWFIVSINDCIDGWVLLHGIKK